MVQDQVDCSCDETGARERGKFVTNVGWHRRRPDLLERLDRANSTAADRVNPNQVFRALKHLERLSVSHARVVSTDQRLENFEVGSFLAKIAAKPNFSIFLS